MTFGGFNDSIVVALCIFTVVTGARVAYGSWFWEFRKSWWHTEQEIEKLHYDLERSVKLLDQVREMAAALVTKRVGTREQTAAATLNLPC